MVTFVPKPYLCTSTIQLSVSLNVVTPKRSEVQWLTQKRRILNLLTFNSIVLIMK